MENFMKNYLNHKNLLNEGFFTKLFKLLQIDPDNQDKIKKSKKIKSSLVSLNKSQDELEYALEDLLGKKINLNRYSLKDFLG
jgi:ribosomal protein L16 Arg81 hydroxylase